MIGCRAGMFFACISLFAASPVYAGPPSGFELRTLVSGLDAPTAMAYTRDGRILISEKTGRVRVFANGRLHEFIDLRDEVNHHSDRGLNNLIVDDRGRVYLFFTAELRPDDPDQNHPAGGKLIRVEAMATNPNRIDHGSRKTLISGFDSRGPWHSIGGLDFDARGNLVIGFGDGSPYYPKEFSSAAFVVYDTTSLSGKILRIDPDTGEGIPGNPFYDISRPNSIRSKVIAWGFRMPYRLTVDRSDGAIFVGDVGTDQWEEINMIPPPARWRISTLNYGWPCYEGGDSGAPEARYTNAPYCASRYYSADNADALTTPPSHAYDGKGGAAMVLGPIGSGRVFAGDYDNRLFLADFIKDRFWTYENERLSDFGTPGEWGGPTDIDLTPEGSLAYTALLEGKVNEIAYVGDEADRSSYRDTAVKWIAPVLGLVGLAIALALWRRARLRS